MLTAKQELAAISVDIAKKQNELQSFLNQIAAEKLKKALADLSDKNRELLSQQAKLQRLAESRILVIQQQGAESAAIKKELAALQTQVLELREAKAQTEQRLKTLQSTTITRVPAMGDTLRLSESLGGTVLPLSPGTTPTSSLPLPLPSPLAPNPQLVCRTKLGKTCSVMTGGLSSLGGACSCGTIDDPGTIIFSDTLSPR
jgi:hypothetical protein